MGVDGVIGNKWDISFVLLELIFLWECEGWFVDGVGKIVLIEIEECVMYNK